MNYALIESGIVTNIIWLSPSNAADFPNAVSYADKPVSIGDTYTDGKFYRDGTEVLTPLEDAQAALANAITAEEASAAMKAGVNSI